MIFIGKYRLRGTRRISDSRRDGRRYILSRFLKFYLLPLPFYFFPFTFYL